MTRQSSRKSVAACFLVAASAAFVQPLTLAAEELRLVVPPGFENTEGNESINNSGVNTPYRAQTLHLASEFSGMPAGGAWLVGSNLRLDRSMSTPLTVSHANSIFRVSTTARNTLSTVFADNIGADETLVYEGLTTTFFPASGPPEGPRGFGMAEAFQTPFHYDPSMGNLLFDFTSTSGFDVAFTLDAVSTPGSVRTIFNLNPASPVATVTRNWAFVRELVFVPEPSSCLLVMMAFGGIVISARSRTNGREGQAVRADT